MKHMNRLLVVIFVLLAFLLSACGAQESVKEKVVPVKLEPMEGTDFQRVILTEKAAERIDLQTVSVSGNEIPYAAVIYDIEGNTWVYTSPKPLTFVRAPISIDHIEGETAILAKSLDSNLTVVTRGVAELYGAETGVSK